VGEAVLTESESSNTAGTVVFHFAH
jgi:hypothetical protein